MRGYENAQLTDRLLSHLGEKQSRCLMLKKWGKLLDKGNSRDNADERAEREGVHFPCGSEVKGIERQDLKNDMKITDKNIEALLFDYAEGELTVEQRAEVERYLVDHPACIELLESYKEGICSADAPRQVFEKKYELVKIATSKPKRRSVILASRKVWHLSAAAVALVFAVVFAFRLTNEAEKLLEVGNISESGLDGVLIQPNNVRNYEINFSEMPQIKDNKGIKYSEDCSNELDQSLYRLQPK